MGFKIKHLRSIFGYFIRSSTLTAALYCSVQPVYADNLPIQEALVDLNKAVQEYQLGNRPDALQALLTLATDPQYPKSIQLESRIYIAEILYLEGNIDGARQYFLEVLAIDPSYSIDRFRHPPDICIEFDSLKSQLRQQPKETPLINKNYWSRFAPFAVYQFRHDRLWKGIIYGGLQLGSGVASLTLFNYLSQNPGYNTNDTEEQERLQTILQLQRASSISFYSVWLLSSLDAQRHWQLDTKPVTE